MKPAVKKSASRAPCRDAEAVSPRTAEGKRRARSTAASVKRSARKSRGDNSSSPHFRTMKVLLQIKVVAKRSSSAVS
jgi:hypothetical protein